MAISVESLFFTAMASCDCRDEIDASGSDASSYGELPRRQSAGKTTNEATHAMGGYIY